MAVTSADMSLHRLDVSAHEAGGRLGPTRVVRVDVDELSAVDCEHPAGGLYSAVWVLAVRSGQPLGMVEIEVSSPTIGAEELGARLRDELDQTWQLHVADARDDVALPPATVVVPTNVGRPEQLLACVARLCELDYPHYEVLVVDNRPRRRAGRGCPARAPRAPFGERACRATPWHLGSSQQGRGGGHWRDHCVHGRRRGGRPLVASRARKAVRRRASGGCGDGPRTPQRARDTGPDLARAVR